MAYSISRAARLVLGLLDASEVEVEASERDRMSEYGLVSIGGFNCRVANILSLHSAKVIVNTAWFNAKRPNYGKPYMQRGPDSSGLDYQLILGYKKVHALHYLDLRHYALFLEKDREHWFGQSHWGIQTNEEADSFVWEGGNTLVFPLLHLTSPAVLQRRDKELFDGMRR
jgi:hypothetical protein